MKKVAICFSGQLRCHVKLFEFWTKNFFRPIQQAGFTPVVFYNTADDEYYASGLEQVQKYYKELGIEAIIQTQPDLDFKDITPEFFELYDSGLPRGRHNQLIRDLNSIDEVIKLKRKYEEENNMIFEAVVRTRPDVIPVKFDPSFLEAASKSDKLFISDHDHHGYMNGRFTISTSQLADSLYMFLEKRTKVIPHISLKDEVKYFAGEFYWMTHVRALEVPTHFFNFKVYLVRDYDSRFPEQEQGVVYLDGVPRFRFERDEILTLKNINITV